MTKERSITTCHSCMVIRSFQFGETLIMSEEKDVILGFEPVVQFLPSARFKSGNNLVHRHRMLTRLTIPGTTGTVQ